VPTITYVEVDGSVDHNTILQAFCPAGTQVIAGGANSHGDNADLDFTGPMRGGSPWSSGDPQPDAWGGSWWDFTKVTAGAQISMSVYAVCAS
jgi:hypothetical protein